MLPSKVKSQVISECNYNIVPDPTFNYNVGRFPSEWFTDYFSFLNNSALQKNLGEAFYQARFVYKLMKTLHLSKSKYYAFVKFQILQYASIYEAILDYCLEEYYKDEIMTKYADITYTPVPALSKSTNITYETNEIFLCTKTIRKKPIKLMRIQNRTDFAAEKGIISDTMQNRICDLYDTRNNIHILKATQSGFMPKLSDAKTAYKIMDDFVSEIKTFLSNQGA